MPTVGNFNKAYHSIQLISIGIVCEDGREYYAVSSEFEARDASEWVMENVIRPIFDSWKYELNGKIVRLVLSIPLNEMEFSRKNLKYCIGLVGKSNRQIANEVVDFITGCEYSVNSYLDFKISPEFYAYYADYDWVLFCSLFGTMMDLPKGFPMYCVDLKQELERKRVVYGNETQNRYWSPLEEHTTFPKQTNEHNALADAKWNFELYKFLKAL